MSHCPAQLGISPSGLTFISAAAFVDHSLFHNLFAHSEIQPFTSLPSGSANSAVLKVMANLSDLSMRELAVMPLQRQSCPTQRSLAEECQYHNHGLHLLRKKKTGKSLQTLQPDQKTELDTWNELSSFG
jgi:hypothetical protein